MKNTLFLLLLITFLLLSGTDAIKNSNTNVTSKYPTLKLHHTNLVILKGQINSQSADKVIENLLKVFDTDIYLYIVSNGGSVIDGNNIIQTIDTLSASGKNIICIAD